MSWLEKVSEKLGIIEEDYEDDLLEEKIEGNREDEEAPALERRSEPADTSIPPEFLQHQQVLSFETAPQAPEQEMYVPEPEPEPVEQPVQKNNMSQFTMQIRSGEVASNKKGGFFGGKSKNDMDAVSVLAQALNIVEVAPEDFDDSQRIADCLRDGQPVIVNYEGTDIILANRIKDFISGVTYALGGSLRDLGTQVVFCSPKMVDVRVNAAFHLDDK